MPMYEYVCDECQTKFEALRPMSQADAPIACEHCESEKTTRVLSVFIALSGGSSGEAHSVSGGGCACGGHRGCGHSHN